MHFKNLNKKLDMETFLIFSGFVFGLYFWLRSSDSDNEPESTPYSNQAIVKGSNNIVVQGTEVKKNDK